MSALTPRQMFLLDEACRPIFEGFGSPPYLVGTAGALEKEPYRDVDVRLILDDKEYDRLEKSCQNESLITFLGLAIGEYLQARTGLPVDFQIQRQTNANHHHDGPRNALGCVRQMSAYAGDGKKPLPKRKAK